jgi:protein O-mannosyl-transferase
MRRRHNEQAAESNAPSAKIGSKPPPLQHGSVTSATVQMGACLSVFLVAVLTFVGTFSHEFVYDDSVVIVDNADLRPETPLGQIFKNDYWGNPMWRSHTKSFRPLTVLTFRLNYLLGQLSPFGYHVGNVLLHGLVCVLVLLYAQKIQLGQITSFVVALLFATHPIHVEAVANVSGRAEMLSAAFFIASLWCHVHALTSLFRPTKHHWGWLACSMLAAAAATFSKEPGITALLANVAIDFVFVCGVLPLPSLLVHKHEGWFRALLQRTIAFLAFFLLLALYRLSLNGEAPIEFSPADNPASFEDRFLTRVLSYFYVYAINGWLLLYPKTLLADYTHNTLPLVHSFDDPSNLFTLGFILVMAAIVLFATRTVKNPASANTALTVASSAPTAAEENVQASDITESESKGKINSARVTQRGSNKPSTPAKSETPKAQQSEESYSSLSPSRRRHPTSTRQSSTSTLSACTLHSDARLAALGLAVLIIPFLPASNIAIRVGFVVAERVLYVPSLGFLFIVAAIARAVASGRGKAISSVILLVSALVLTAYFVRSVSRAEDWASDVTVWEAMVRDAPWNPKTWKSVGLAYRKRDRTREAEAAYTRCIELDSDFGDCLLELGMLWQKEGRNSEAEAAYKKIFAIKRRYYAIEGELRFSSLTWPTVPEAMSNLGVLYATTGENDKAEDLFRRAYALAPARSGPHSFAYSNLVYFLQVNGRANEIARL